MWAKVAISRLLEGGYDPGGTHGDAHKVSVVKSTEQ
jgi:hypothetical protein